MLLFIRADVSVIALAKLIVVTDVTLTSRSEEQTVLVAMLARL